MRQYLLNFAAATMLLALCLPTIALGQPLPDQGQGFVQVFEDTFDTLRTANWCSRLPYGGGTIVTGQFANDIACTHRGQLDTLNDEIQRYREGTVNDVAMHDTDSRDGYLRLNAVRTGPTEFASGMIRSKFVFKPDSYTNYYVTAVTQAPHTVGTWSTFWLVPSTYERRASWPPELDISETPNNLNSRGDCVQGLDSDGDGLVYQHGQRNTPPPQTVPCGVRHGDLRSGVLWTKDHACFTLNDAWDQRTPTGLLEEVDGGTLNIDAGGPVTCQPYQWKKGRKNANSAAIIFNLAIGGEFGGGNPAGDQYFFDIDHVRLYRKCINDGDPPTELADTNDKGESRLRNCTAPDGGPVDPPGDPVVYCKGKSNKPENCTPRMRRR